MSFKKQIVLAFALLSVSVYGQDLYKDTLKLTVQKADSLFIVQNLSLLAEKCNIDAAQAQVLQAKVFNNITFGFNQNVLNTEYKTNGGRKWFDYTSKGESSVQLQKLFQIAGQRNKQIKLARLSANKEEQLYFDLLRTLKFSLRSSLYNIYYLKQIVTVYDKEIASMNSLIAVYQSQFEKGYISKKELLRLKSSLFSLENERIGYTTQLLSNQADFNVLMHTSNVYYKPEIDSSAFNTVVLQNFKLQALIDTATQNRFDLKMAQSDVDINQTNLSLQKAMGVPDVALSTGWDRNGSYVHDYNYIGVQFDLPIFNRNQGNIKSAKAMVEGSKYNLLNAQYQVKADVITAYANALETDNIYAKFDKKFVSDLEILNQEMLKNFEKKNISLIEFLDYYDAYKENAVQLNNLLYNRINAFENINFSIGKDIIIK
jgi:outer membrane protein, heavy metal efflux system